MMTTLGSLKLSLATTSAAAMLRCPVPRANARRVSRPGPPSIQPVPKPSAINRSPARIPRVPQDVEDLVDIRYGEQQHRRNKAYVANPIEHGLHSRGYFAYHALKASPPASGSRVSRNSQPAIFFESTLIPRNQQRQYQGQVTDRADRQRHHDANGEGQVALGKLGQLGQERRASCRTKQQ